MIFRLVLEQVWAEPNKNPNLIIFYRPKPEQPYLIITFKNWQSSDHNLKLLCFPCKNERLVYGWRKIMENITHGYGHHT